MTVATTAKRAYLTKQARVLLSPDLATITSDGGVTVGCANCGADTFYGFVDEPTGQISFAVRHVEPCAGGGPTGKSRASLRIERRA